MAKVNVYALVGLLLATSAQADTLVFSRQTSEGWRVFGRDARGERQFLPEVPHNLWAWGVRGDQLLLLSRANADAGAPGWRAHRMHHDGSDFARAHSDVVGDGYVDLAPDGRTWAAEMRIKGQKRIVFFEEGAAAVRWFTAQDASYADADPQFSPDGRRLLFRSDRGGSFELWSSDLDGGDARQVTSDSANNGVSAHEYGGEGPARWSPDGRHIAAMRKFPDRGYDIWVMDADGSNARAITDNGEINDAYPSWSPDGKRIAFDSNRDGNNEIYAVDVDNGSVQRMTETPETELAPIWIRAR